MYVHSERSDSIVFHAPVCWERQRYRYRYRYQCTPAGYSPKSPVPLARARGQVSSECCIYRGVSVAFHGCDSLLLTGEGGLWCGADELHLRLSHTYTEGRYPTLEYAKLRRCVWRFDCMLRCTRPFRVQHSNSFNLYPVQPQAYF